MLRIYNTVLAICLVSWLSVSFAMAQAPNCSISAFGSYNVLVDHTGETGQHAREMGVQKATERALAEVLTRVIRLPDGASLDLSDIEAADFVEFIHIQTENALATRYIATLDICFDSALTRQWMIVAGYEWTEIPSPEILILPIWQDPSGVRVWQRNNVWLQSWSELPEAHRGLVRYTSLEANLQNERKIHPMAVFEQQPKMLQTAAKLAKAQQILWVYAVLNYGAEERRITLKSSLFDRQGEKLTDILERSVILDERTNMAIEFDEFRAEVIGKVENAWKQVNVVSPKLLKESYIVSIDLRNLKDWRRFHGVLRNMPAVRSAQTIKLGVHVGSVRVKLAGSADAFEQAIQAAEYELRIENGQYHVTHKE